MAKSLREVMSGKTVEEVTDYITNFNKYTPEAISAAADELRRRGIQFTEQDLLDIQQKIDTRAKAEKREDSLFPSDSWKVDVVTDTNAPLLYSKGAIRGFCIFFTTIFGAVLLASNVNDPKGKWTVIGFGIIYTVVTMILVNLIPPNTFLVLILNSAGGLGLTSTFWNKYVGRETTYRAKPIWKPLIISFIIIIPFVLALIYG